MNKKILIIPIVLLSITGCTKEPSSTPNPYGTVLNVYSFNDVHGQVEGDDEYIGLDRAATYIKSQENYKEEMTLIMSAGDMYQGTGISNLTDGHVMVDVMNEMKFDVMTVGNHEFDWTIDTLKSNIERSDFPVISYDIYDKTTNEPVSWVDPYAIIEKGIYKIGVIGEIGGIESSIASTMITNIDFKPNVDEINNIAKELKDEKDCDVVFLLTHNGPSSSYRDLDENYVKAIFGGHTHDVVTNTMYGTIPYVQGGKNTKGISQVTYNFETESLEYSVKQFAKSELAEIERDSGITSIIAEYSKTTSPVLNEVVGKVDGQLNKRALGKLVTKAMYEYAIDKGVSSENLLAIHNDPRVSTLGVIGEVTDVTYNQIYQAFPFDNDVRLVKIQGSLLRNSTGNHFYGVDFLGDLDSNTVYNVITISYYTENENGLFYNDGGGECLSETLVYCRDLIRDMFRSEGVISATDL